jgi:hypothetical protein
MTRGARRKERMGAVILVVVVAVIGVVAGRSGGGHQRPSLPTLARVTGFRGVVVIARSGDFLRADFAAGKVVSAKPPAGTLAHYPTALLRRHGGFAFAADGRAYSAALRLEGPLTPLGTALDVLPSVRRDRVWLVDPARTTAREVDLRGHASGRTIALPPDGTLVAEVDGGWLVTAAGRLEVRDLVTGATRVINGDRGVLFDASSARALWAADAVHVIDVVSGTDRSLAPLPTRVAAGALSPDGHHVGLITADGALVIDDHPVGGMTLDMTRHVPLPVWSTDERAVFVCSAGGLVVSVDGGPLTGTGLPCGAALTVS